MGKPKSLKTIYIDSFVLAEAERQKLDISKVCEEALNTATGISQAPTDKEKLDKEIMTISTKLAILEAKRDDIKQEEEKEEKEWRNI